ncbi:MAG: HEAT repeat domain-containing protein [Planctomycetes bacterium]|nr:HEAT repeat domain-containing protein [Planctomycetota bacterium]
MKNSHFRRLLTVTAAVICLCGCRNTRSPVVPVDTAHAERNGGDIDPAMLKAYSAYITGSSERDKKTEELIREVISSHIELFDLKFELAQNDKSYGTETDVIMEGLKDPWPEVILHILGKIQSMPKDKAGQIIPSLHSILVNQGQPDNVKIETISTLGNICPANSEDTLAILAEFIKNPAVEMRKAAVEAIGQIGGKNLLITALSDKNSDIQQIAVRKLGGLKDKTAAEHLIYLYNRTYTPKLKQDILVALADIGETEKTAPFLLGIINTSSDWEQLWFAIDTLGKIATPSDEICDALSKTFRHPNTEVRLITVKTFGSIRICRAVPLLTEAYSRETDQRLKDACVSSLQTICKYLIEKTEWKSALETITEFRKIRPDDQSALKDAALCLYKTGEYDPAMEKIRQVINVAEKNTPLWLDSHILQIEIMRAKKNFKAAINEIDRLLKANSLPEDFKKKLLGLKDTVEAETANEKTENRR